MVVEYNPIDITNSLQGAERVEGGFTRVVTEDNVIQLAESDNVDVKVSNAVATSYTDQSTAMAPLDAAATLRGSSTDAGEITEMAASDVLDERYTVGYAPVEDTNWVVLVHAPYSSVFGFVQQIQLWGSSGPR